ncbi:MAG: hypothetical protein IJ640_07905 [Prevotella sp.]|nr:hypothetical protein [Prevotella sp.]
MSQWTHVCGCIRVDSIRMADEENEKANIRNILGRIVRFTDDDRLTTLPLGSEGSIEYAILTNPDKCCVAAYVIPIWGDLRDYDDVQEIEDWFHDVCSKLFVRNAVLNIDVENGIKKNIAYEEKY